MTQFWTHWFLPSAVGILWFFIALALYKAPGIRLKRKFSGLFNSAGGGFSGISYDEVTTVCGQPVCSFPREQEGMLCQWAARGYHIALFFDAQGICPGICFEVNL